MFCLDVKDMDFEILNKQLRQSKENEIQVINCLGQRYIGCALKDKTLEITGIPGNALGSYNDGAKIIVNGNAQDAVGDTMNAGEIIIKGSAGDGIGLSQRGGEIYVRNNVGYRAGVHMKQYKEKMPVLMIGGSAGSFLGEYLAGGYIVVLGLNSNACPVGNFCAAGMYKGEIFIRGKLPSNLPEKVNVKEADEEDISHILPYINKYCNYFNVSKEEIFSKPFFLLTPDSKNPFKQLYVFN